MFLKLFWFKSFSSNHQRTGLENENKLLVKSRSVLILHVPHKNIHFCAVHIGLAQSILHQSLINCVSIRIVCHSFVSKRPISSWLPFEKFNDLVDEKKLCDCSNQMLHFSNAGLSEKIWYMAHGFVIFKLLSLSENRLSSWALLSLTMRRKVEA